MNDDNLDEYLMSAQEQGYRDFWDGYDKPDNTMPSKEREYWQLGYNKAHMEATNDS